MFGSSHTYDQVYLADNTRQLCVRQFREPSIQASQPLNNLFSVDSACLLIKQIDK